MLINTFFYRYTPSLNWKITNNHSSEKVYKIRCQWDVSSFRFVEHDKEPYCLFSMADWILYGLIYVLLDREGQTETERERGIREKERSRKREKFIHMNNYNYTCTMPICDISYISLTFVTGLCRCVC